MLLISMVAAGVMMTGNGEAMCATCCTIAGEAPSGGRGPQLKREPTAAEKEYEARSFTGFWWGNLNLQMESLEQARRREEQEAQRIREVSAQLQQAQAEKKRMGQQGNAQRHLPLIQYRSEEDKLEEMQNCEFLEASGGETQPDHPSGSE
jgi:hypothetical protein